MARRAMTTTGLPKQIHTLYHETPNRGLNDWKYDVVDWHYHGIESVHPIFHQAVDSYAGNPYSNEHTFHVDGIWPRRSDESGPSHWTGNPTR